MYSEFEKTAAEVRGARVGTSFDPDTVNDPHNL
jgi:hypothetical protein